MFSCCSRGIIAVVLLRSNSDRSFRFGRGWRLWRRHLIRRQSLWRFFYALIGRRMTTADFFIASRRVGPLLVLLGPRMSGWCRVFALGKASRLSAVFLSPALLVSFYARHTLLINLKYSLVASPKRCSFLVRKNLLLSVFWRMWFFARCGVVSRRTCSFQRDRGLRKCTETCVYFTCAISRFLFILNVCNLLQKLHTAQTSVGIIVTNVGVCMSV